MDTFTNVYWPFVLFLENYLFISLAYLFNVLFTFEVESSVFVFGVLYEVWVSLLCQVYS